MKFPGAEESHALQSAAGLFAPFASIEAFNIHLPMANFLAKSTIIHESLQGNPANCMLVMEIAARFDVPVLSLAQSPELAKGMEITGEGLAHAIKALRLTDAVIRPPSDEPPSQQLPTQHLGEPSQSRTSAPAATVATPHPAAPSSLTPGDPNSNGANTTSHSPQEPKEIGDANASFAVPQAKAPAPSQSPSAPRAVTPSIDFATFREICLRAESTSAVKAAAEQLVDVVEKDRNQAEKELVELAMIYLAEERTPAGMSDLASIRSHVSEELFSVFKAAYNARVETLNKAR